MQGHVARTVLLSREAVYFILYIIRLCLMVSYNSILSGTYTQFLCEARNDVFICNVCDEISEVVHNVLLYRA